MNHMINKGVGSSFKLTVQERIIIHLSEYSRYMEELEVPFTLTQEGIAQSVGVVRSAIPRAIKKLISKNHVNEILAHVTNLTRRRKVYYLTREGLTSALELKNKLIVVKIKIKNLDGELDKPSPDAIKAMRLQRKLDRREHG